MAGQILVPFPHMALNSHNVPPPDYLMHNTWKVAQSDSVDHIVGWVLKLALERKIATLIFNAHGDPGKIYIGQGINLNDLVKFQAWNTKDGPLIKEIWIVACRVGGKYENVSGGVDGESFLKDFLLASGAIVTGAIRKQIADQKEIPIGYIDKWEGEVLTYDQKVKIIRQF